MAIFESVQFLNEENVIISSYSIFNESDTPKSLTSPPLVDTPKGFKDQVVKIMEDIESESGKKVGSGIGDAAFGNLKIKLFNAVSRIKKQKVQNTYSIIVPFSVLKHMNPEKSGDKLIESILKSNGFQKGGKMAGDWNGYWYKSGNGFINAAAFIFAVKQIQIHFFCAEDTKDNLAFIKANH